MLKIICIRMEVKPKTNAYVKTLMRLLVFFPKCILLSVYLFLCWQLAVPLIQSAAVQSDEWRASQRSKFRNYQQMNSEILSVVQKRKVAYRITMLYEEMLAYWIQGLHVLLQHRRTMYRIFLILKLPLIYIILLLNICTAREFIT